MYVPSWPGLGLSELRVPRLSTPLPFPLSARRRHAFYRARSAIYHLGRALRPGHGECFLAPDYHSGGEVEALRAAGWRVRLYPIGEDLQPDLEAIDKLSRSDARGILVIHYLGWAQPIGPIRALCERRDLVLVEDCALSMLSRHEGRPLGSSGDYSVFCLYKTLPVPHGGLLVQNGAPLAGLDEVRLVACGVRPLIGRTTELLLERLKSRSELAGAALVSLKRAAGRMLNRLRIAAHPVGDVGFAESDLAFSMSPLCEAMLHRFDYDRIVARRRSHYALLDSALTGIARPLMRSLDGGVCPLFYPVLVADKPAAARALRARGIEAVEFWNPPAAGSEETCGPGASFLRRHVLELPIHQDLTESHVTYIADTIGEMREMFEFPERQRRSRAAS